MTECCICHKELKSWETFGPVRYPVCQAHYWEHGERLEEINAIGLSNFVKQRDAFQELVGLSVFPQEARKVIELEKQIEAWNDEIEDLQEEIWHLRNKINDASNEIRKAKAKAKDAAVVA